MAASHCPSRADDAQYTVALLVETSTGWGRRLVRGIQGYARRHGPWYLRLVATGIGERPTLPPRWRGDGVIARVQDDAMARQLAALRVPVVNISGIPLRRESFPRITTDTAACGELAVAHFADRGFRQFAYVGPPSPASALMHRAGYEHAVATRGGTCDAFVLPADNADDAPVRTAFRRWLARLRKPVAVFTWAQLGVRVIDECRSLAIRVPEDVAVLSNDYDDVLCENCVPSLSAIETATEYIGGVAAETLHALMDARSPGPPVQRLIGPTRVVVRMSSDTLAIDDAEVSAALRFIRLNATRGIDVDDVLRDVALSRRSLERRFLRLLGRSPTDEIRRVRLEHVKHLLATTEQPMKAIARASGFGSREYMSYAFKRDTGQSPAKFRREATARR